MSKTFLCFGRLGYFCQKTVLICVKLVMLVYVGFFSSVSDLMVAVDIQIHILLCEISQPDKM